VLGTGREAGLAALAEADRPAFCAAAITGSYTGANGGA
jgi:hypothetical protein